MSKNWRSNEKKREREERYAAQQDAEREAYAERLRNCWQVPEHAREAYLELEDQLGEEGAAVVNKFLKQLLQLEGTAYAV